MSGVSGLPSDGQCPASAGKRGSTYLDGLYQKNTADPNTAFTTDAVRLDGISTLTPGPRANPVLAYDSRTSTVWLYGGEDTSGRLSDLWRFDLGTGQWQQVATAATQGAPPAMLAAGVVLSPVNGNVHVIAGTRPQQVQERCWRFDGVTWTRETRVAQ